MASVWFLASCWTWWSSSRGSSSVPANSATTVWNALDLGSVRIVQLEGGRSFQHRVNAGAHLQTGGLAAVPQLLVALAVDVEGEVVQRAQWLLAWKAARRVGMGREHDHLGHSVLSRP